MSRLAWPHFPSISFAAAVLLAWPAGYAAAQTPPADVRAYDPPAHVAFVEGAAVLERDGRIEQSPASMPLLAGDRLRTYGGRVEVLFADGATLHLDSNTVVDFQSDEVMRLLEGRIRLNIPGPSRDVAYRIDAPAGWVQISEPGEFRVSLLGGAGEPELEVAVLRGAAELVNEDGRTPLRAGERAFARLGAAPSYAYVFNSAAWDAFDQWSEARRNERLGAYAEYLPGEVRPYGAILAQYGSWRHEPTYGHVWYPRVHVGWRPYYYGRWTTLRPYGWTWIGHDPWAWPTHHYGRWGFSAGLWFWIPGRHWGPAWVSWAYAPGYVSWCPLGWNNRPVFSFISLNIFGGRRYDPWHGWTVLPHRRFGSGFVHANVVNITHLDVRARRSFVVRERAPDIRGFAVPRAEAPIRLAGTRGGIAVPRIGGAVGPGTTRAAESRRDGALEAAEVFRNRRATTAPSRGQGFPAPARDPRTAGPISQAAPRDGSPGVRGPETAATPPERRPGPVAAPAERGAIRRAVPPDGSPRPGVSGTATPSPGRRANPSAAPGGGAVRRATPRTAPDAVPAPQTPPPSRTDAPSNRRAPGESRSVPQIERRPVTEPGRVPHVTARSRPSAPVRRAGPQPDPSPRAEPGPSAVPRSQPPSVEYYRGSRREAPPAARSDEPSQPGFRRAPAPLDRGPSGGTRSFPAGRPSGESPAFRGPAVERRAPGPPPSGGAGRPGPPAAGPSPGRSAPPQSASPESGSSPRAGAPSRSRGGQSRSGSARPRGGE